MKLFSALVYCPLNLHSRISSLQSIVEVTEYLKMNFKPVFSRWFDIGGCNAFKCFWFFFYKKKQHNSNKTDNILPCRIGRLNLWMYMEQIYSNSHLVLSFPTSIDASALCICFSFLKNLLKYPARHTSVNVNG